LRGHNAVHAAQSWLVAANPSQHAAVNAHVSALSDAHLGNTLVPALDDLQTQQECITSVSNVPLANIVHRRHGPHRNSLAPQTEWMLPVCVDMPFEKQ
jgi:hypothetical protein